MATDGDSPFHFFEMYVGVGGHARVDVSLCLFVVYMYVASVLCYTVFLSLVVLPV